MRPFRARRSTWGLTGTPLLSSETRITELAALCGGTYVCGNAAHWRTMERASTRDVFLRYHESASSLIYLEERTRAARRRTSTRRCSATASTTSSRTSRERKVVPCALSRRLRCTSSCCATKACCPTSLRRPDEWRRVREERGSVGFATHALAQSPARMKALRETVKSIHKEADTKIIVFAPSALASRARARLALRAQAVWPAQAVLIGDPNDAGATDVIDEFARPDIRDPSRPVVLLMSFDYSSALNLQHVAHNIIFYAPLWGDDPSGSTRRRTSSRR